MCLSFVIREIMPRQKARRKLADFSLSKIFRKAFTCFTFQKRGGSSAGTLPVMSIRENARLSSDGREAPMQGPYVPMFNFT